MKNKIILVLLSVIMLFSLVSCTKAELIPDSEAQQILTELLPKAEEINDIIWGKGLPVEPGQDGPLKTVTAAQYRTVSKDAPYQSTDELKKAIAEVYSDAFIENTVNYTCFEGADDALENTEAQMYPRYKDNDAGVLIVDITNSGFEITTEIDPASAKVISAEGNKQTLEVETNNSKIKLVIVKQENGWRLDTPTY